ncbi:MAG: GTPase [Acholeplasmataceae bacterium]|jgi:ribosome biogenesis GTPase A|nr:50S ribosome-binding GTPase [Acholeplasmataceae bacterium]MCK9233950.1 50S ribosome-binding GTPase [Acholeplasmataceae bacterium]MCK9288913.1 50S ribosome-binding GTPase [Acholeplasmataceae bacterium]MCK9427507.1 50S ribosome-binding GTPase [Acholeplasmataceae bacterium]
MRCKGCGVVLQTDSKEIEGYTPKLSNELCYRCFILKHYQEDQHHVYKSGFPKIDHDGVIIYLVSLLHLNTLFMYNLNNFYNNKMILLVNHVDLLPKTVDFDKMVNTIKKNHQRELANFLSVLPISALKGYQLEKLLNVIISNNFKKVYLVGLQNSGKSTLVNKIASHYKLETAILASKKPGLTKDILKLKTPYFTLYDTPGVYLKGFIDDYLSYQDYYPLIPDFFKAFVYNLKESQTIIVFGLFMITLLKGETSFVFYGNKLKLHRTKKENASALFKKHQGELFKPTVKDFETNFLKLENKKYLINLMELGFLVVKGAVTLEITKPKGANVFISEGVIDGL